MQIEISEDFIEELKIFAEKYDPSQSENFCTYQYTGGSLDEAFELGTECSEIHMAQWILDQLGVEY